MGRLLRADLTIAPTFLMMDRPAKEQLAIMYLWGHALTGEDWTFSSLKKIAGCNIDRATLDQMVEDKILARVPEPQRKTTKPCHEYYVDTAMVPDRAVKVPDKAKSAAHYPPWVWRSVKIWREHQGVLGPQRMTAYLKPAVSAHGEEVVMAGLERYARRANKKFFPSPDKFARNILEWIQPEERHDGGRDMRDMV